MAFGVTTFIPILGAAGAKDGAKYGLTAGTYIGTGAATAAIVNTQLNKIHFVYEK